MQAKLPRRHAILGILVPLLLTLELGLAELMNSSPYYIVDLKRGVQGDGCITPANANGFCVSLEDCPEVLVLFKTLPHSQATEYSRELRRRCNNRITPNNYPVVCCTQPSVRQWTSTSTTTTTTTTMPPSTTQRLETTRTTDWFDDILKKHNCVGPQGEPGVCKDLANCSEMLATLQQNPTNQTLRAYIRSSHGKCGFSNTDVCCPSIDSTNNANSRHSGGAQLPSEADDCGVSTQPMPKILGGEDSIPGSWPWAALLGYDKRLPQIFRCGGTLISAKHVVTAAHCLEETLSFVRLGEWDLNNDKDTAHVDVEITRYVGHPEFLGQRDKRHDIALIFLERTVQFTNEIAPICLPGKDLRTKSYVDHNPIVVGWGKTQLSGSSATKLQQLQISVFNVSVCRNIYTQRNRFAKDSQFDETVLCAGNLVGGKDSCSGDSGGGLFQPEYFKGHMHFYLIGVVSYGIGCGLPGVPGIYSSVQYFMDWIEATAAAES